MTEEEKKKVTRRDFLKGAAVGGVVGAAVSAGVAAAPIITAPPTISGSAEFVATIVDIIADKTVDLDEDGTDDLKLTTRRLILKYTGVMEGTAIALMTITQDLHTNIARASTIITFSGRVGDSEPGTMTIIATLISDRSGPIYKAQGTKMVVEGSGLAGLEGISGGGSYQVEGPPAGPFTATAHYEFRFHSPKRG